jgi:DNA-binding NarL/FixJ family response regulator
MASLSERERQVLELMAEGWANHAISERLCLSPKTVETHISNIFVKLDLGATESGHRRVLAVLHHVWAAAGLVHVLPPLV